MCLDRDSKSISLDPKNLLHRYYGIEVVFQPTQPSHILSVTFSFFCALWGAEISLSGEPRDLLPLGRL